MLEWVNLSRIFRYFAGMAPVHQVQKKIMKSYAEANIQTDSCCGAVLFVKNENLENLKIRNEGSNGDFEEFEPNSFSENDDDKEVVMALFKEIDTDGSQDLSEEELKHIMDYHRSLGHTELVAAFERLLSIHVESNESIHFDDFFKVFRQLPRVRGERIQWARTLHLDQELARLLKTGNIFDGLYTLKTMSDRDQELHISEVCSKMSLRLPAILRAGFKKLRLSSTMKSASLHVHRHLNSKFVLDGANVGRFAVLRDFYRGPEALIGVPNPKIFEGLEKEHTLRGNAHVRFTTKNYNVTTWPQLEWEIVVNPRGGVEYPHTPYDKTKWRPGSEWTGHQGRQVVPLSELVEQAQVKDQMAKAGLRAEEVICLRLYTGPMFVLYNAALRRFPAADVASLLSPGEDEASANRYETTIFVIASGITKLSKVTGIPTDRRLYRGLGGILLPDHFWREFAECQVTFLVQADTDERARRALRGLEDRVVASSGQSMIVGTKNVCTKVLSLAAYFSDRHGAAATRDSHFKELRVVEEGRIQAGRLRMVVALPISKLDFTERRRAVFRDAIGQACGMMAGNVTIDEVADKPEDFKGGGKIPFEPSPAIPDNGELIP